MIDQLFILLLAVIAGHVAYGLYRKKSMWKWIVVYWSVLTVKNLVNLLVTFT